MKRQDFLRQLDRESSGWVDRGLIDEEQRGRLLEASREAEPVAVSEGPTSVRSRLPAVLIGLAVVLLSVGIILFYAANWQGMTPTAKLCQVFCLHIGLYAAAYWLLALSDASPRVGHGLLFLAMMSFGVALALIAQIFHISAHPADGVLVWSLVVLAVSAVTRHRWGAYLGAALLLIWNGWEVLVYANRNLLFVVPFLALIYVFYLLRQRPGFVIVVLMGLHWFYQLNAFAWSEGSLRDSHVAVGLFLLHVPLGVLLVILGRLFGRYELLGQASVVATFLGWCAVCTPFVGLLWPVKLPVIFPFFGAGAVYLFLQYLAFLAIGAVLLGLLHRRGERCTWLLSCIIGAFFLGALPVGVPLVLMLTVHLGLLGLIFGLFYSSYRVSEVRVVDRLMAFILTFVALVVKQAGFMTWALGNERLFLVYTLGFVVFALVVFLVIRLAHALLARRNRAFSASRLTLLPIVQVWFAFYMLSFKLGSQQSIGRADGLFEDLVIALALVGVGLLYGLWAEPPERVSVFAVGPLFLVVLLLLASTGLSLQGMGLSILFNILLFIMVALLLYYSMRINSGQLANLAIVLFIVQVVTRYFDVLWELLSGSVLFITTGLIVLLGGYLLERNRRKLLTSIRERRQEGGRP